MNAAKKRKRFLSIRWKMLLPLIFIFGILTYSTYILLDETLEQTISEVFQEELFNMVKYIDEVCLIDRDLERLFGQADFSPKAYNTVLACFDDVVAFDPRAVLITYRLAGEAQHEIGIDSDIDIVEGAYEFGEVVSLNDLVSYLGEDAGDTGRIAALLAGGLEEFAFQPEYFVDHDGNAFFSGYAPLFDEDGNVVSGLIITVEASDAIAEITDVQFYLTIGVVSCILSAG